jgi:hypothetical protein
VRHFTDVGLCAPGDGQDVVGSSAPSDLGNGDRPVRRASARLPFPEGWLALVAIPALIGGVAIGFLAPFEANGLLRPVVLGSAVAGLLLGAIGGALWPDPVKLAWMGALEWSVVLSISAHLSWYRGSLPEEESGGLGLVIGFVFVITVVPIFAGALLGHELRRSPLATSAAFLGGAAFLATVLWFMERLLSFS